MQEKIRTAAIFHSGKIFEGKHHAECFSKIKDAGLPRLPKPECRQGFITDSGRFVDRIEGLKIATEANQIVFKFPPLYELLSEDLVKRSEEEILKLQQEYNSQRKKNS
jgi:hypothetical protein